MVGPVTAVILILALAMATYANYRSQHSDRIFTGVNVMGVDLSGLNPGEAQAALEARFPYPQTAVINFSDPATGQSWQATPAELGLTFDAEATVVQLRNQQLQNRISLYLALGGEFATD